MFARTLSLRRAIPAARTLMTRQAAVSNHQLATVARLKHFGAVAGCAAGFTFLLSPFSLTSSLALAEAPPPQPTSIAPAAPVVEEKLVVQTEKKRLVIASWNARIWAFL